MIVGAANRFPVSRSSDAGVPEIPAQRHAQRFVKLSSLLQRQRQLLEARCQPRCTVMFVPARSLQPLPPRSIGLDIGVVFKQWNKSRSSRAQFASRLIVLPGDFNLARQALSE